MLLRASRALVSALAIALLGSSVSFGWIYRTVGNAQTGRPDLITPLNNSTVQSGSNVTVTNNADGSVTINSTGGGGGGSSTLEVFDGPARTSPTVSLSGYSGDLIGSVINGTTFQFALNPATTDFIHNQTTLQSGAVFYASSGTVDGQLYTRGINTRTTSKIGSTGWTLSQNSDGIGQASQLTQTYQDVTASSNGIFFNDSSNRNYAYLDMGNNGTFGYSIRHSSSACGVNMCAPVIRWSAEPRGPHGLYDWNGNVILWASAPLSTSQFVKTDAGQALVSYDLLNATQTWTGTNTFAGGVNTSSSVLLSGSSGTNGQVLTSGGFGTAPTWTTISSGGGGTSTLQTTKSGVQITSPTNSINFFGNDFLLQAIGSTTTVILNPATTNYIQNNNTAVSQTADLLNLYGDASAGQINLYDSQTNNKNFGRYTLAGLRINGFGTVAGNPQASVEGDCSTNNAGSTIGVLGAANSQSGISAYGVQGTVTNVSGSATGYAVYGSATQNTGTEYAGYFSATGSADPKYAVYAAAGSSVFVDSLTVLSPNGEQVNYNINVGSITGAGLATCGDATHALGWSSTNNLFTCQSVTGSGGGGGGASTLAIGTGTSSGWAGTIASSPTAVALFDQSQFSASLQGGATSFIRIKPSISNISANFTIGSTSTVVLANCSAACTVTLPTAVGITGITYTVKIIGTGSTSIATTSAQTIDGSTTVTPLPNQYASLDIISDGSNWEIK